MLKVASIIKLKQSFLVFIFDFKKCFTFFGAIHMYLTQDLHKHSLCFALQNKECEYVNLVVTDVYGIECTLKC